MVAVVLPKMQQHMRWRIPGSDCIMPRSSNRKAIRRLHRARIVLVSQCPFKEVPLNSLTVTKGVNFSSCPDNFGKCYCEVNTVDGIMKAARFTEPCISTEGCITSNGGTFTFEGELDPGNSVDFDEAYENDDRERFEDALCHSKSVRAARRHLLEARYGDQEADDEYGLRENRLANENFKDVRGYRTVLRSRSSDDGVEGQDGNDDDQDDDDDDDEEDENLDDSVLGGERDDEVDDEDEEDEEDADETIGLRGSAKGRRSPRKRIQEARPDYAVIAFEGKHEVDEPARKGPVEIRSVMEDCEEDTTEPLQYYDYESGGTALYNLQVGLALKLAALSVLAWFHEH